MFSTTCTYQGVFIIHRRSQYSFYHFRLWILGFGKYFVFEGPVKFNSIASFRCSLRIICLVSIFSFLFCLKVSFLLVWDSMMSIFEVTPFEAHSLSVKWISSPRFYFARRIISTMESWGRAWRIYWTAVRILRSLHPGIVTGNVSLSNSKTWCANARFWVFNFPVLTLISTRAPGRASIIVGGIFENSNLSFRLAWICCWASINSK